MDSKILDVVTRWAEPVEPSESAAESTAAETTEDESESLLTPPISTKSPVSILTSLRDSKPVKKKVKFADEASSSDSESRTSELEFPSESDSVSSSSGKQFKKKSFELRKKLLDKDRIDIDLKEILKGEVTPFEDLDNQQEEVTGSQGETAAGESAKVGEEKAEKLEDKVEKSREEKEEKIDEEKAEKVGEKKTEKEGEEKVGTEKLAAGSGTEEDSAKPGPNGDEVTNMASELLNIWANLKVLLVKVSTIFTLSIRTDRPGQTV